MERLLFVRRYFPVYHVRSRGRGVQGAEYTVEMNSLNAHLPEGMDVLGLVHSARHVKRTMHPRHATRGALTHLLIDGLGMTSGPQGRQCVIRPDEQDLDDAAHEIKAFHSPEYVRMLGGDDAPACTHGSLSSSDMSESDDSDDSDETTEPGSPASVQEHSLRHAIQISPVTEPTTRCKKLERLLDCTVPFLPGEHQCREGDSEPATDSCFSSDCPRFEGMWSYVKSVVAGSVLCAGYLTNGSYLRTAHWEGGRHHARPSEASGFCYVADVVLATEALLSTYRRILVLDLDVHHGDGTQAAFYSSSRVFTLSFHMHGRGVFPPSSGTVDERGADEGRGYSMNVPLQPGCTDAVYHYAFRRITEGVKRVFDPDAVVVVCGGDVLYGDPLGQLNVTVPCMLQCLSYVRDWNIPTLLLGGGGYDEGITARYWASLTHLMKTYKQPEPAFAAFDPFDSSQPLLGTEEVRRLGSSHVPLEIRQIPPEPFSDAAYNLFSPYSLLPHQLPSGSRRVEADPNFGDIRLLVHTSLSALLATAARASAVKEHAASKKNQARPPKRKRQPEVP